jgi:uncharacterized protein
MSQIVVRQMHFVFPADIDRHWLGSSPFRTHFFNSLTLLFPEGEQLAIRVFKKKLNQIQDAKLKSDVVAFIGQEGQHAAAHGAFWTILRQQGYKLDTFSRILQIFISKKQRFSTEFYISTVAGFEHFTDCLSEFVLESDYLADVDPQLKELFEWHFAEELEHKTVAYNVFLNSSGNYLLRILGLLNSHASILGAVSLGLIVLLSQDKQLLQLKTWQDLIQFLFLKEKFFFRALSNFFDYWRIDFHPSQKDSSLLYQKLID